MCPALPTSAAAAHSACSVTLLSGGGGSSGCSPWGYFWMVANCCTTAGYVLYMKHATKTIKLPRYVRDVGCGTQRLILLTARVQSSSHRYCCCAFMGWSVEEERPSATWREGGKEETLTFGPLFVASTMYKRDSMLFLPFSMFVVLRVDRGLWTNMSARPQTPAGPCIAAQQQGE